MTWAPAFLAYTFLSSLSYSSLIYLSLSISIMTSSLLWSPIYSLSSILFSCSYLSLIVTTLENIIFIFMSFTSSCSSSSCCWALESIPLALWICSEVNFTSLPYLLRLSRSSFLNFSLLILAAASYIVFSISLLRRASVGSGTIMDSRIRISSPAGMITPSFYLPEAAFSRMALSSFIVTIVGPSRPVFLWDDPKIKTVRINR